MAPEPDDGEDRGPYTGSTETNTDPTWMNDPTSGQPIMGDGVRANLDDLTGYSYNLNQVRNNVMSLSNGLTTPLTEMITGAFGGTGNGLKWNEYFLRLSQHNAGQLEMFLGYMSMGIGNVAMAAQAVANAYGNVDETSAAGMNAVHFAFGDKSKAPDRIPQWLLDRIPTWNEFTREHPEQTTVIPQNGLPPDAVKVTSPDGLTTTVTVRLPDGRTMTTTTSDWGYYGATGRTQTVAIDGKVQTTTRTTSYGGRTETVQTQTVYGDDGRALRDQVTSRSEETVTSSGGAERTDRRVTTYSYDDDGDVTDESTTGSTVSVGRERAPEPVLGTDQDPGTRRQQELMPEPDPDEVILAPGPLDGSGGQPQPGTGTV